LIYSFIYNQSLLPLTLWAIILHRRGVLETTLCEKVSQLHAAGGWFSTTDKTDRHDITEILLKVAINTMTLSLIPLDSTINFTYFEDLLKLEVGYV